MAKWLGRGLLVTGSLVVSLAILEVVCLAYYWRRDGRVIPVTDKLLAEHNAYVEDLVPEQMTYADLLVPHPYLSYVHNPYLRGLSQPINRLGLMGHEFPIRKEPGVFVILVTGGSVASQLAGLTVEDNVLEQELNERYIGGRIRRFLVLNGGAGAWHQPQQFILFALYAQVLDGVVTLDGFNERYVLDSPFYQFELPAENYVVAISNQVGDLRAVFPLWVDGQVLRAQQSRWLRHSRLVYCLGGWIRGWARRAYREGGAAGWVRPGLQRTVQDFFQWPQGWSRREKQLYALEQYKKYIRFMNAIADHAGIRSLFTIQPCPAVGKRLTPEERKIVGSLDYGSQYQMMAEKLLALRDEGVPIYSLLDAFVRHDETIYRDAIHVSPEGNRILARRILELLEREWDLVPRSG
jgi:hypothetical protein